jgi:hypothetical protein
MSGNWSTGSTWDAGEPTTTTAANIDNAVTVAVEQTNEAATFLDIGSVDGASGALTMTGGDLTIVDADPVDPENLVAMRVGFAAGSTGTFNMSGGTVFIDGPAGGGFAIGDLIVGDNGNGTMTLTGGEVPSNDEMIIGLQPTSTSTLDISAGTLQTLGRSLLVSFAGNGTLKVSGTAEVTANFDVLAGFIEGSTSTIVQSGGTITSNYMFSNFGSAGTGSTTNITMSGGTYNVRNAYVLGQGNGTTTMNHTGGVISAQTNNGDMVVADGDGNTSVYNISGTAQVNLLHNFIVGTFDGPDGPATGTVNQNGGTITAGDNLAIARDGNGTWNLNSGTVSAHNAFLGDFDSSNGTMKVAGGTLNLSGDLNVGAAIASNAAPDRVAPDGSNGAQGQALDANGTFIVVGTGGDINVSGNLLANPADKSPARNGAGEENSSLLKFTLGSTGISPIDVGLKADLDGAVIDIDDTIGFFSSHPASTITLISAAGGFGNVYTITPAEQAGNGKGFTQAAGDSGLFNLQIVPRPGGGEMLVASKGAGGLPGDIDGDGDVDGNDFILMQRAGFTAAQLTTFKANFGSHSATGAAAAVPEPAAAMLLVIGCAALAAFRGKGQA